MEIIRSKTPSREAGKKLAKILANYIDSPVLLMLSGGSAFSILEEVEDSVLGRNITLTVLDERYSQDPTINNFTQLTKTDFYTQCIENGVNVISTKVQGDESRDDVSNRWSRALYEWRENNPTGVIIATMGIGTDGHTAGIFPNIKGVDFDSEKWVVAYSLPKATNEHTERITVTNTFIKNQLDVAVVYAVGDNKKKVVTKLISSKCDKDNMPACVIKEIRKVDVYTDE